MGRPRLSEKSMTILSMLAQGYVHSQIVESRTDISYNDIYHAAEEALQLSEPEVGYQERIEDIKAKSPQAYEKWTAEEDAILLTMH